MNVDALNQRMCDFALARLDAMGEEKSGLYNYYAHLARRGYILRPEEIAVAAYIERTMPRDAPILELCAGAAQLGHLLALDGYTVSAVEVDRLRVAFATDLGAHLGSTCAILSAYWQTLQLARWRLLVTINAYTSMIVPQDVELIRGYVLGGGHVILRPRQFGHGIAAAIPGLVATEVFGDVYHYRAA